MATPAPAAFNRLSRDEPAGEDAFGAHKAIACAIKKLILTSDTGFGIALVGEPGSGKSTVLQLLRGECQGEQGCDIAIFRFEAWAHERDNLRRAFLQELADFLDERSWKSRTKRVRGKLSPQPGHTSERLTLPALFLALGLLLLLTPGSTLQAGFGLRWAGWVRVVGVWASFIGAAVAAYCRIRSGGHLLSVLARTEATSISTPAPTSIEFQGYFRELLSSAGLEVGKRVLVIALEDFDRLPQREREEAWSVMRTYTETLLGRPDCQETWRNAVWTIVPLKARDAESEVSAAPAAQMPGDFSSQQPPPTVPQGADELGRADRLCQIEFPVPPPLLTRWREFLMDRLKEQLAGWSQEDRNDAVSVYAARLAHRPLGRTPRSLLAYVNELVAIDALRSGDRGVTPDAVIQLAANIKAAAGSVDPLDLIRSGQAGSRAEVGAVASLLYNRDRAEALVAALGEDVLQALRFGDRKKLAEFLEQCGPALLVAETIIGREADTWAESEPRSIGNAAFALALNPGVLEGNAGWTLAEAALKAKTWRTIDDLAGEGLGWLCRAQKDLASRIFQAVSGAVDDPAGPPDVERIAAAVNRLVERAEDSLPGELSVGKFAWSFLQFAASLHAKNGVARLARYLPGCGHAELVSCLKSAGRDEAWVAQVTAAALAGVDTSWLVPFLKARPQPGDSLASAAEFAAAVMVMGRISASDAEWVRTQPGRAISLLASAQGHPAIERAIVLGLLVSRGSVLSGRSYTGSAAAGQQRFEAILGQRDDREWDAVAGLARDSGSEQFLREQMRRPEREGAMVAHVLKKLQST